MPTQIEITHPAESAAVKALDAKLLPLRERYNELFVKVHHWKGLLSPYVNLDGSEREYLEAKFEMAPTERELAKLQLEIGEVDTERACVYRAEKERTTVALDHQRREIIARLAPVLEEAGNLNQELLDLEQSYPSLGVDAITDYLNWPELVVVSTPTWTPPLPSRLQSWRQNGWLS